MQAYCSLGLILPSLVSYATKATKARPEADINRMALGLDDAATLVTMVFSECPS